MFEEGDSPAALAGQLSERAPHPDSPTRAAGRRRRDDAVRLTLRGFVAGVAVVLVAQAAAVLYLTSRSYFFAEDFTYLEIYRETPVTSELLRTSIFGHLLPGFILVQKYFGIWFG